MNWQKLLTKNTQNLFLLINYMKDLSWKKAELAAKMQVDIKTIDRYLKRLESGDYPLHLVSHKKEIRLVYHQGYSEPYLLFDFLIQSDSFCLLRDLILQISDRYDYDRSAQERLRRWLGEYHLSFSYKKRQIYGSERKIRYLLFRFLKEFPHFFAEGSEQPFSELFIQLLEQRRQSTTIELLGNPQLLFHEIFPELLFRSEQSLPQKEKNYRAIIRLSCNLVTEKRWKRIEKTQIYRKLTIVTEKLDSLFWLTSEFESSNKTKITRILFQEWMKYSIGIHDRLVRDEFQAYQYIVSKVPYFDDKLNQFRLALQQAILHPTMEWGAMLLKLLQERGYLEMYPPEVKIVFFFRYDHEEARRLAAILDKTLRHRKRTSIHVCARNKPPSYAQLIITDHFFPLDHNKDQKTYFYQNSLGIERLLTDIDYWITTKADFFSRKINER
ncbi:hypothetical protein A5844_000713 [Enterococcus sp. 10A9_DIV0425]|uniref:Mga helix-turn-helix domain-containing protein n=1 Tax=Candidatus Enterococcus wittei TaxID=1987383 RepID=A0A2C9XQM7_9ENTE|nr:hypothetical protein [Enterococcus sp. 10A9_DIV0425]OTP12480.1 hypothetical protein A5844_000713 [Enterococcus sp. 10A9_DIV0425]THE10445.1 hypothetical protein E1H99_09600 [Enterococcus hirae]